MEDYTYIFKIYNINDEKMHCLYIASNVEVVIDSKGKLDINLESITYCDHLIPNRNHGY